MESRVEEQLKTTLHCDDKEKLRRKLALLQREYLRTAQKLQRAERREAVHRHVKSRITQQGHLDQSNPEVTSNPHISPPSLTLNPVKTTDHDSDDSRSCKSIRFLLPSDDACPQTPEPSQDEARGHRPSSSLRLRSRRSRLRWERRSAEAGRTTDSSGQEGHEQSDWLENAKTEEEEKVVFEREKVVEETKELYSSSESESPSLLLTHWKTHAHTEIIDTEENKVRCHEQVAKEKELTPEGDKESDSESSLLLKGWNPAVKTEERENNCTLNEKGEEIVEIENVDHSKGQREIHISAEDSIKDTKQNADEKLENEKRLDDTMETEEKNPGIEGDGKSVGLTDSCTLVEGLIFPVEYYVRTTRRMTVSQSQPDMQAVLLSQLSGGRRRSSGRGRGRASGLITHKHTNEYSVQHTQTDLSSPNAASVDLGTVAASTELDGNSQSSVEISASLTAMEASSSPAVSTSTSGRGRRRKRGRGGGRTRTPRSSLCLDTHQTEDPQPTITLVTSSPALHEPEVTKPCLTSEEAAPVPVVTQNMSTCSAGLQPSPGTNGDQCIPASGSLEKVYPIFLKSNGTTSSTEMNRCTSSWQPLLLPSSSPAQTSLLPLPSTTPGSLVNSLTNLDIHQDFHLPDDQFASLKLEKLRKVALESGVEHFASPSYNTRRSKRLSQHLCGTGDPVTPLSLPLSPIPTISDSQKPAPTTQSLVNQHMSTENKQSQPFADESAKQDNTDISKEQQTEDLIAESHTSPTESVPVLHHCENQSEEHDTPNTQIQISVSENLCQSNEVKIGQSAPSPADRLSPLEDESSTSQQSKALSCNCSPRETPEEASNSCTAEQKRKDGGATGKTPGASLLVTTNPTKDSPPHHGVNSQLLLSPSLSSAHCPFISPHPSSPPLPSLGLTPHSVSIGIPLTCSPAAPALTLPPPYSPSTQALSPPALSPCPSITSLPSSQPPVSPSSQKQASDEPSVKPSSCPASSCIQTRGSGGQVVAEQDAIRRTQTLKAPAGGCLVDTCCLAGPSGGLCVAAAGKWAVCLWSQTPASNWSLVHTWNFDDPVINVFPVPDAAGLLFVTLGQLEIKEVRLLSSSSLTQVLLCEGVIQVAVGVSKSRVVTSSHSATGSTLQVFNMSGNSSTPSSQPLVSPGVCVGALAPVDGLCDALIGTDENACVFVWNLKTGQLLRRIVLGDGLSHTACLRGYSYSGVLFVLLQHQSLSFLEEREKEAKSEDELFSEEEQEERKKAALFSLVALNPLSCKSVLAAQLYPHEAWSGRLCEADVHSCSVVGLSQSGCVCVWELGRQRVSRMLWAPEGEGWQLARWGGRDTLVTGHHNGDVTLHHYKKL